MKQNKTGTQHQASCPTGLIGRMFGHVMALLNRSANARIAEIAISLAPEKILEIGCGPGQLLETLASRLPQTHLLGIDVSDEMIRLASRRLVRFNERVRVVKSSAEKAVAQAKDCYSLICAVHSFQFWKNPESLVPQLKHLLSPNGHVLLCLRLHTGRTRQLDFINEPSKAEDQVAAIIKLFQQSGFQLVHQESGKVLLFQVVTK